MQMHRESFGQVSSHVFARISSRVGGSNTGFILCEEGIVVVDTAPSRADSQKDIEAIRQVSERPFSALILTHYHSDHWFGAQMFDCEIVASEDTEKEMRHRGQDYLEETRQHHRHLRTALEDLTLVYPTCTFGERMALEVVPAVEVIRMGGHTTGTSVVYIPDDRVLFASDLVFNGIHAYTKGADIPRWVAALDEILGMGIDTIVPGHGAICGKAEVSGQKRYLNGFLEQLCSLKQQGYTVEEIVADLSILDLPELHRARRLAGSVRAHWDMV